MLFWLLLLVEDTHDVKQQNKNRETIPNQNSKCLKPLKLLIGHVSLLHEVKAVILRTLLL